MSTVFAGFELTMQDTAIKSRPTQYIASLIPNPGKAAVMPHNIIKRNVLFFHIHAFITLPPINELIKTVLHTLYWAALSLFPHIRSPEEVN